MEDLKLKKTNCDTYYFQVGPAWTEEINKELDQEESDLRSIRQNEIDHVKESIEEELRVQADGAAYSDIIAAKKEAVGLQLEAAYRARLVEAHQQVGSLSTKYTECPKIYNHIIET